MTMFYRYPLSKDSPDSKVHGANMGPTWALSVPDGLHVVPMNLAIREASVDHSYARNQGISSRGIDLLIILSENVCISATTLKPSQPAVPNAARWFFVCIYIYIYIWLTGTLTCIMWSRNASICEIQRLVLSQWNIWLAWLHNNWSHNWSHTLLFVCYIFTSQIQF